MAGVITRDPKPLIREETAKDQDGIRRVNREAFGSEVEGRIVDRLRTNGGLILSLVAQERGEIVGHIAFSPVIVTSPTGETASIVGLAPMSVVPRLQGAGVGGALVRAGLERLREKGHQVVILLGHADYFPRFGFEPSSRHGIRWEHEAPDEAFMVLELVKGALGKVKGVAAFRREFEEVS